MDTIKIDGQDYEVEFKLYNADNQEILFSKSSIRGMTLVESIFDVFMTGTISIANAYDLIESDYLFRGDGRDKFIISFKPKDSKDEDGFYREFYIIDDSETVNPNVRSENIKTLNLVEISSLKFTETIPFGKFYQGNVGDILKEVFKEILGEDAVDNDNWEKGDFTYDISPPLTWRYIDLIYNLMQVFYAKDGDLYTKGFVLYDKKTKKYQFKLISKIFEDNKKLLQEAFFIGDNAYKQTSINPYNPPAEAEIGPYAGVLRNIGYSTPLYGWNTDYFLNYLVFGYDKVLGVFNIRKLTLDSLKEKWKTKFVDVFKTMSGKPKPFIVTNRTTKKRFKQVKLPYTIDDNVKLVEADIYNTLTFYNLQCSFVNIGDTRRSAGKFIDIIKANDEVNKGDAKLIGRWIVTELKHVFFGDLYFNEFSCTKTYVGPDSNIDNDAE